MFRQLSEILNDTEKKKAIAIAVLSIFSALLETLGVGVILPFILAMLQPMTLLEYDLIKQVFDMFNIKTPTQIVAFMGIGVICIYKFS